MSHKDSIKNLNSINTICSCLEFSGKNCLDFVNSFLLSDLTELKPNQFHYSALCNPKGRIISSFWIGIINKDQIKLICPINLQNEMLAFFTLRKFRLKIEIKITKENICIDDKAILSIAPINISCYNANKDEFYRVLFENNLPWIDKENTEKFIPQHVNLDQHNGIMSFKKGCYPGQEIIARLKYLGNIKKRLLLVESDEKDLLEQQGKDLTLVSPIIYNKINKKYACQIIEKLPS